MHLFTYKELVIYNNYLFEFLNLYFNTVHFVGLQVKSTNARWPVHTSHVSIYGKTQ